MAVEVEVVGEVDTARRGGQQQTSRPGVERVREFDGRDVVVAGAAVLQVVVVDDQFRELAVLLLGHLLDGLGHRGGAAGAEVLQVVEDRLVACGRKRGRGAQKTWKKGKSDRVWSCDPEKGIFNSGL